MNDVETVRVATSYSKESIINKLDYNNCPHCGSKNYEEMLTLRNNEPKYLTRSCGNCYYMEGMPVQRRDK